MLFIFFSSFSFSSSSLLSWSPWCFPTTSISLLSLSVRQVMFTACATLSKAFSLIFWSRKTIAQSGRKCSYETLFFYTLSFKYYSFSYFPWQKLLACWNPSKRRVLTPISCLENTAPWLVTISQSIFITALVIGWVRFGALLVLIYWSYMHHVTREMAPWKFFVHREGRAP